ncbi:uncharacterized protein MAM_07993 [Metarhizium album ARSEF 1941]|uniref:Uncharacterized protein n=1 Tax=Metarhizium album (strain ARSEF 1941) TaxID=1081103 RepID=A0A0B2WJN4_METAS|nr:uncharacterized protein MAM_07993 [Metarhizium album ARSEF 1941]KHN94153.1 hypothetical protein MAM_07993 [Metarhizium album ARSEF 1941]
MAARVSNVSASTQNRILIWRSEVASALDDVASSAASSTGIAFSLSDTHSSAGNSMSQRQHSAGALSRGRRIWRRIARRLSGGRFGGFEDEDLEREPAIRTAMYRAPPPPSPVNATGVDTIEEVGGPGEESSDGKVVTGRGLMDTKQRLERAALLLDGNRAATS